MTDYSGIVIILLAVSLSLAGCTSQTAETGPTATPSTSITPKITEIPTTSMTPEITEIPTTLPDSPPSPSVLPTLSPEADPTDVSKINFSFYSDNDFSMYYPSTWTLSTSHYTPYICENVLDPDRTDYHVCYQDEAASIGPFDFYDSDMYKEPYRVVTFTSPDSRLKFSSLTKDFRDAYVGNVRLKPTLEWTYARFLLYYPDLTPSRYISNVRYSTMSNSETLMSTYDVTLPENSTYSPSAYSIKAIVTLHHVYNFGFLTDTENFSRYQNLKERMMSLIKTNDVV
jgi:hypothetical protein